MVRVVLLILVVAACSSPAAPPRPAPCPVVEPPPCDAITPEQRQVLEELAELLKAPLTEQGAAVRLLMEKHAATVIAVEKLRTELDDSTRSNGELQARVDQLQSDLEELKRLTIEMEMKAK